MCKYFSYYNFFNVLSNHRFMIIIIHQLSNLILDENFVHYSFFPFYLNDILTGKYSQLFGRNTKIKGYNEDILTFPCHLKSTCHF